MRVRRGVCGGKMVGAHGTLVVAGSSGRFHGLSSDVGLLGSGFLLGIFNCRLWLTRVLKRQQIVSRLEFGGWELICNRK